MLAENNLEQICETKNQTYPNYLVIMQGVSDVDNFAVISNLWISAEWIPCGLWHDLCFGFLLEYHSLASPAVFTALLPRSSSTDSILSDIGQDLHVLLYVLLLHKLILQTWHRHSNIHSCIL